MREYMAIEQLGGRKNDAISQLDRIPVAAQEVFQSEVQKHRENFPRHPYARFENAAGTLPKDIFEVAHGKSQVIFCGVPHTPTSWMQDGETLLKAISKADIILTEINPRTATLQEANEIIGNVPDREKIMRRSRGNPTGWLTGEYSHAVPAELFFNTAAKIGIAAGKRVMSADPDFGQSLMDRTLEAMNTTNLGVDEDMKLAKLIGQLAAGALSAVEIERLFAQLRNAQSAGILNRRTFLHGMGALGAVGVTAGLSQIPVGEQARMGKDHYKADDTLYASYDFRDLIAAQAIDQLTKSASGARILVLYGRGHVRGIANYLQKPLLTKSKRIMYAPYEHDRKLQVFEYSLDKEGKWTEKAISPIE